VQVNPVEERAADFVEVALHYAGCQIQNLMIIFRGIQAIPYKSG